MTKECMCPMTMAPHGHCYQVFRFNLHGSLQYPGLDVGQFVGIRGELDGEIVQGACLHTSVSVHWLATSVLSCFWIFPPSYPAGFYSPVSRPGEQVGRGRRGEAPLCGPPPSVV